MRRTSVVKASCSFSVERTGLGDILVIQKTVQGSLANLGVDLAVVFQFDPGLGRFIELVQRQIGDAFEHGQQPALDLAPKSLLLSVLIRANMEVCFQTARPAE